MRMGPRPELVTCGRRASLCASQVASLPGGVRLRLLSAHDLAGPLAAGAGDRDVTGLALWPAATTLAEHVVERERELVAGRRVLDVGCGAGLVGIAAAAVGAEEVVMIDGSPLGPSRAHTHTHTHRSALSGRKWAQMHCLHCRVSMPLYSPFMWVRWLHVLRPDPGDWPWPLGANHNLSRARTAVC